jgi:hypothetical protein
MRGVDAAIIAAATSSNEPIEFAAAACLPKGRIVLEGVAGLQVPRPPVFAKELEFTVSFSLAPGRADRKRFDPFQADMNGPRLAVICDLVQGEWPSMEGKLPCSAREATFSRRIEN